LDTPTNTQKPKPEAVIEPDLPVCDAHHHLWDYPGNVYLGNDLNNDINGNNVVKTIFVEAWDRVVRNGRLLKNPSDQTALGVKESNSNPGHTRISAGIVGYVDLMNGKAVETEVESHIRAGEGRFRGIRFSIRSDIRDKKFQDGYSVIINHKLTIDAVVPSSEQLLNIVGLAQKYPETPVIVNHMGIDFQKSRHFNPKFSLKDVRYDMESWKKLITELAVCDNIYMKLGGLGMDLGVAGWEKETNPNSEELAQILKPWYLYCIEKFSIDRCMLESNFPVDKKSFSYNVYWNATKRLTKDFSPAERNSLFYGTAVGVYRL
jgi:L-fuconolactonase